MKTVSRIIHWLEWNRSMSGVEPARAVAADARGRASASAVTLSPILHAVVLSGTVTRADHEGNIMETDAGTQIEAVVTRDGAPLGSIQVNAIQVEFTQRSPLAGLVMGLAQGSRSVFVSRKFAEVVGAAAQGARHGIGTSGLGGRFLYVPPTKPAPDVAAPIQHTTAASAS